MPNWNELSSGLLGETDSYAERAWGWWPASDTPALLEVQCEPKKGGRRVDTQYDVVELPELPGLMGREFKLTKQGETPEEYQVTIGPLYRCSCMAGQTRGKLHEPCKHIAAMRAIAARGLLGGAPFPNLPPADVEHLMLGSAETKQLPGGKDSIPALSSPS